MGVGISKVVKGHCRTDTRLHFFSPRVLNRWNSLSQDSVDACSVDAANGPVSQVSNLQRITHHSQNTEIYSIRCSATMSSSDCTKRRKQQQQQTASGQDLTRQDGFLHGLAVRMTLLAAAQVWVWQKQMWRLFGMDEHVWSSLTWWDIWWEFTQVLMSGVAEVQLPDHIGMHHASLTTSGENPNFTDCTFAIRILPFAVTIRPVTVTIANAIFIRLPEV